MDDLSNQFSEALKLQNAIDPPEKPYESKYKARKILNEIICKIDGHGNDALIGGLYATIGVIDVEVEELSTGILVTFICPSAVFELSFNSRVILDLN